jgi:drug/metabolite transporter (DMT)-like permease
MGQSEPPPGGASRIALRLRLDHVTEQRLPLTSRRGLGWMALAQLCFAFMNVCTRLGSVRLPWAEIAAARFLIGALIAVGLAAARGVSLRATDRAGTWHRSIYGTLSAVGNFYALGSPRIGVGDAATLIATAPIFVALLSGPMLGERVARRLWVAVLLAFAGIAALVRPSFGIAAPVALVATLGAFCYAMAMIWLRRIGPGESHEAVVLHFSLTGLATMLLLALPGWRWPDTGSGLYLLGAGLGGGGAQLAMTRAYSLHRAAPVTALSSLGIVFTYLLALPLFPRHPGWWQVGGSLLVILATGWISFGHDRHTARARTGV